MRRLTNIRVHEGSFVPKGDNPLADIAIFKARSENDQMTTDALVALLKGLDEKERAAIVEKAGLAPEPVDPDADIRKELDEAKAELAELRKAAEPAEPAPIEKAIAELPAEIRAEFTKQREQLESLAKSHQELLKAQERAAAVEKAAEFDVGWETEDLAEVLLVTKSAMTAEQYGEFCRVLKSASEVSKRGGLGKPAGTTGGNDPGDNDAVSALAKLEKRAREIATADSIPYGVAYRKACDESPETYKIAKGA